MKRVIILLSFLAITATIFCQTSSKNPLNEAEAAKMMGNRFISIGEAKTFWEFNIPGFKALIDASISYTVSELSDTSYYLLPIFNLPPETLKKFWNIDPDTKISSGTQIGYLLLKIRDYDNKNEIGEDTLKLGQALEAIALLSGCHRYSNNLETMFATKDSYKDEEGDKKRYCFLISTEPEQEALISALPINVDFGRFSQNKIFYVAGRDDDEEQYFGMEMMNSKYELRPSQWQTKFVVYVEKP